MFHTLMLFSFGLMLFTTPGVIQITLGLNTINCVPPEQLLSGCMYLQDNMPDLT